MYYDGPERKWQSGKRRDCVEIKFSFSAPCSRDAKALRSALVALHSARTTRTNKHLLICLTPFGQGFRGGRRRHKTIHSKFLWSFKWQCRETNSRVRVVTTRCHSQIPRKNRGFRLSSTSHPPRKPWPLWVAHRQFCVDAR